MGYRHITEWGSALNDGILSSASQDCASSYNMDKVGLQSTTTPSGMREDILLASWLIVLLRTREGERVAFDWTYQSSSGVSEEPCRHISMDDVMKGLQDSVGSVIRAISSQTLTERSREKSTESASLLLSTNLLQQQQQSDEEPTVRLSCLML